MGIEIKTVNVITCPLCGKQGVHPKCQQEAVEYLREHDQGELGRELRRSAEMQATMRRWHDEMEAEKATLRETLQVTDVELDKLWSVSCDKDGRGLSWNNFYRMWRERSPELARKTISDDLV